MLRAIGLTAALFAAGCASTAPSVRSSAARPARQEQAAALFDAATHRDKLRLKLLVDWSRYRLAWAWSRAAADHAEATTGLSQIEAEPSPSEAWIEMAVVPRDAFVTVIHS